MSTTHEVDLVQLYATTCDCTPEQQADEDLHPEDAFGSGPYCLLHPIGTACRECSDMADGWTDHIEIDDKEEDEA